MMATYSRQLLSQSVNGMPIKLVATATPGTLVHTALAGTTGFDEVYLWFTNTTNAAVSVTIEFGDATAPDHHLVDSYALPANCAPIPLITGQVLQNSKTCAAYVNVGGTNAVVVTGYVNRIQ
jgi:hypothetical protein